MDWAAEHVTQLRKLLPAGLEPCGCFVVIDEAGARDLAGLLVTVLKGIDDPLVLSIDGSSRKLTFWQHVRRPKPALRPALVKADAHKEVLLLWSATPIDILVPHKHDDHIGGNSGTFSDSLADDLEKSLAASLDKCTVGFTVDANKPIRVVDFASEQAVSDMVPKDCNEVQCVFLHNGTVLAAAPNPEGHPWFRQRCLIVVTAVLLRRGMELRHAIKLLQKELVACAAERLQLALDEAEGEVAKLQLPWRAFCRPEAPDLPLWCGDYCMPDEEPEVAVKRLGELLGLPEVAFQRAPPHLDEHLRLSRDFGGSYGSVAAGDAYAEKQPKGSTSALSVAACAAAVLALVAAAAIPLLLRM